MAVQFSTPIATDLERPAFDRIPPFNLERIISVERHLPIMANRSRLEEQIVDVAVTPIVTRLQASDDRMLRPMEMLRRMLVRRLIATPNVAARQAEA